MRRRRKNKKTGSRGKRVGVGRKARKRYGEKRRKKIYSRKRPERDIKGIAKQGM